MRYDDQPQLHPVAIRDLRPTQITVGLREVTRKRREWRDLRRDDGPAFLGRHMIPAVIGPKRRPWIVDHHHLALALRDEGIERVLISVVADLSDLPKAEFLTFMDNRNWLHPFDAAGRRRPYDALPKTIDGLLDDPFRSLAGDVRRSGGYAEDVTPHAEFLWADFLRRRIEAKALVTDYDVVLEVARAFAADRSARHLPGWVGRS
jgi:hypothetical protein